MADFWPSALSQTPSKQLSFLFLMSFPPGRWIIYWLAAEVAIGASPMVISKNGRWISSKRTLGFILGRRRLSSGPLARTRMGILSWALTETAFGGNNQTASLCA